jgi:hypothetical protein
MLAVRSRPNYKKRNPSPGAHAREVRERASRLSERQPNPLPQADRRKKAGNGRGYTSIVGVSICKLTDPITLFNLRVRLS